MLAKKYFDSKVILVVTTRRKFTIRWEITEEYANFMAHRLPPVGTEYCHDLHFPVGLYWVGGGWWVHIGWTPWRWVRVRSVMLARKGEWDYWLWPSTLPRVVWRPEWLLSHYYLLNFFFFNFLPLILVIQVPQSFYLTVIHRFFQN